MATKISTVASFIESIELDGGIDRGKFGLRSGVSAKDLTGFDSEHGNFDFGSEVVDLIYTDFDGQDSEESELNLFGEFRFLCLREAQQDWSDTFDACGRSKANLHHDRVRDGLRWRKNWFPFAFDVDMIRNLVIDFDPSRKGNRGQIFVWGSSDQSPRLLADSFAEFLQWRLNEMKQSNFSVREDGDIAPIFP